VVDLVGRREDKAYGADSLQNAFSCSKCVSAVLMAMMVDKGYLKYDEAVSSYWPEFAKNGKEKIKVSDVLRHQSGLLKFKKRINVEWTSRENIKLNKIGAIIEEEEMEQFLGTKREYHAVTRDWILNEIFRRVEPRGRTMGEYLAEELKNTDVYCGLPKSESYRCYDVQTKNFLTSFVNLFLPQS
jgi:CubicO group peptidase (beta-lactamase class C family)